MAKSTFCTLKNYRETHKIDYEIYFGVLELLFSGPPEGKIVVINKNVSIKLNNI